jgi:hypothetical protein
MSVDVTADPVAPAPVSRPWAGAVSRVSPAVWLGAMIAVSFAARLAVALVHPIANLFPDEYIYAELGRGFATHGLPLVRGHVANFPSLLAPLLTAPAWLVHDVGTSLRIVQTTTTLSMSLAAVPAYLIARRLRLGAPAALAVAAVTLAVPDFLFATGVLAGAFAYPLSLWSTLAALAAYERPTWRRHALFVGLCALTILARAQFVEIPVAFAVAALAAGLRERRLRRTLREQAPLLALLAAGAIAVGVVGLGFYGGVTSLLAPAKLPHPLAANALLLLFASGWVIVPGALVALVLAVVRPLDRLELLFAVFATLRIAAMLVQAAVYGDQAHERYVFYAVPLLAVAFALYVRRGAPLRLVHSAVALLLLVFALRLPLGEVMAPGHSNSATLYAVFWLTERLGSSGAASALALNVVLAASALLLLLLVRFPRAAARFALAAAVFVGASTWVLASVFEHHSAAVVRASLLPGDRSWVDGAHVGDVTMLRGFQSDRTDVFEQLFWNRSVDRMVALPGAQRLDPFSMPDVTIGRAGLLAVGGKQLRGPLLVDESGSTLALRGGRVVASSPQFELWVPGAGGPARLDSYFAGRTQGGLLLPLSVLELWPRGDGLAGTVRLDFTVPKGGPGIDLRLTIPGGRRSVSIASGTTKQVVLDACTTGPWRATIQVVRGAAIAVSKPVFRPDAARCPAPSKSNA